MIDIEERRKAIEKRGKELEKATNQQLIMYALAFLLKEYGDDVDKTALREELFSRIV